MCDYCSQIELKDFISTPADYEKTIEYMKYLIEQHDFMLIDHNCALGHHKDENGCWIDDVIFHILQCPKCNQMFECTIHTYRGGGSFKRLHKI